MLTYLRVQSLHASSLQVCTHMLLLLMLLLANYIHLGPISCISVVTIVLMLMHVGCRTVKCGSTTCWSYDGTCDGGRILGKKGTRKKKRKKGTRKKERKRKEQERKKDRKKEIKKKERKKSLRKKER